MNKFLLLAVLLMVLLYAPGTPAQTAREIIFVTSNPIICSSSRIYVNRTNKTIWALGISSTCEQFGSGSGSSGSGTGNVLGASSSTDSELLIASGTTGKILKRTNTMSGYVKLASGVVSAVIIPESDLPSFINAAKIADGTVSNAEFQFLANVTSDIQGQLSSKIGPATGTPNGSKFLRDDLSWQSIPGGGDALTGSPLSQFASTTSAQLAGVLTDESGTAGGFVRATGATLNSPSLTTPTGIVKGDVGLGNVDNTSDTSKPVSTATQTALDLKANLASPTFTGTPILPTGTVAVTQSAGNSSTAVATTAFVTSADNLKANLASPTFTGTVTLPTPFTLGGTSVTTTGAQLNFVSGVTSNIQTQLNAKAAAGSVGSSGLTMTTARLLGRTTASTGAIEEITVGSGLTLSGGSLSAAGGGSGTVTVVSSGSLTSTALVTGGGTTTLQTPSASATMDASGNISTTGSVTSGAGSSEAGTVELGEGTSPTLVANTVQHAAVSDAPAGGVAYLWGAAAGNGILRTTNSSGAMTVTQDGGVSHLATSTSADLRGVLSDETGTEAAVFRLTPTIIFGNTLGLNIQDTDASHVMDIRLGSNLTAARSFTITPGDADRTLNMAGGNLTLAGAFTTSGANALTLTTTGTTNVTLPTSGTLSAVVASGTSALGTSAIASGACATAVTTTATGTATTDVIGWGFNGDPTGVTGYQASANGMLTIIAYPSANNVNFKVCNNTASSVTPGAITLNWRVAR